MARENVKRTALAVSMVLAGCALVAVMFSSSDAPAALIHEETPAVVVPETEFLTKAEKAKKPSPKVVHPADHDQGVWAKYTSAKKVAKAKLAAEDFEDLEQQCFAVRTESAKTCGKLYCAAHTTCGEPCPKLYAQPPIQVVPLQPGGPHFHKVAEVQRKEQHNKELKQKEMGAKERATKEHAEKAKEKADKEVEFKERVGKERDAKEVQMKAEEAKENDTKESIRQEMESKEDQVKKKVDAMKDSSQDFCEKDMENFAADCEEKKVKKDQAEAATKEAAIKAEEKKAYASGYSSGSFASGVPPAAVPYVSGMQEEEAKVHEHEEKETEFRYGSGIVADDGTMGTTMPYASAPAPTPVPESYGETESMCVHLSAESCITTLGCHLHGNACMEGEGEAVVPDAGAATTTTATVDPFEVLNTCKDNADWTNQDGDSCSDIAATECSDTKFPGFGCDADGSNCLSSNDACCMCKIEASSNGGCNDDTTWTSNGETCASIATKASTWCPANGASITPGSGCKIDGSNCLSANEACCACKHPAEVETEAAVNTAAGSGRRLLQVAEEDFVAEAEEFKSRMELNHSPMSVSDVKNHRGVADTSSFVERLMSEHMPESVADVEEQEDMEDAVSLLSDTAAVGTPTSPPTEPPTEVPAVADEASEEATADDTAAAADTAANTQPDSSTAEGGDVVGGDVVPSEDQINDEIQSIEKHTEVALAAQAATEKAMAVDVAKVEAAATAATAASLATGSAKALQERDTMAEKFMQTEFIDGLKDEMTDLASSLKNLTAEVASPSTGPQTCEDQAQDHRDKCEITKIKDLAKFEAKLMADAKKKNKDFGAKAAQAAADWGDKLKAEKAAEKHLSDIEDAAEADLQTHVEAQPDFFMEMTASGDKKCDAAKESAYHQCRAGLNEAYLKCAGIFNSADGWTGGTGSAALPMVGAPMQFAESGLFKLQDSSMHEDLAKTKTSFDNAFAALVHPDGDDMPKKVEPEEQSDKAVNTVDDLFKEMGDDGHSASSDEMDEDSDPDDFGFD